MDKDDILDRLHSLDINVNKRVVWIHSQQYYGEGGATPSDEGGVDWKMATKFIKNVEYLNDINDAPIMVKMASCGGDYNFGMGIFDIIKQSKAPVDIHAYVHARSMTSIILQAARRRILSKNCVFMVHYGTYSESGDLRQVTNGLKFYNGHNKTMFNIYAERCVDGKFFKDKKMSKEEVADFIKKKINKKVDWWLNAEDAVRYGFADEII